MSRFEFCTLFDFQYLPRGLALYNSLVASGADFRLRVFCMDERTKAVLDRMALEHVLPISLAELEAHDPQLLAVKPTRTQVEYCWTATPAVCRYCLEREPELEAITYLDADLLFFDRPDALADEAGDAPVVIVPHRFPPRWRHWEASKGVYNVQWMTFRRDPRALAALHWWHARCIEWCYHRLEDGKLGDQKYLDDWPERFPGVHVLQHIGGGLAPWNVKQYRLAAAKTGIAVDGVPLVFFHFHSLRLYQPNWLLRALSLLPTGFHAGPKGVLLVWSSPFRAPRRERQLIWDLYLRRLGEAFEQLRDLGGSVTGLPGVETSSPDQLLLQALRQAIPASARRPLSVARHQFAKLEARRVARQASADPAALTEGWKSRAVAEQMAASAQAELRAPDESPSYRTFLAAIQLLVKRSDVPSPARLLDIGCGVGHFSELLARSQPGRFDYVGCDFSEAMVSVAQELWPGRSFVKDDIYASAIDLDEYDVLVASALIDVVPDFERALDIILGSAAPFVLLHRQRMTSGESRVEAAPAYRGQSSYRTFVSRDDFEAIVARSGREIVEELEVKPGILSFLLARSGAAE